jgi:23S rRNA (cytidine2498-2'-O)-methyltransferase
MHLLLWAEDSESALRAEFARSFPEAPIQGVSPSLLETDFGVALGRRLPHLAFARQWLPNARAIRADSIRMIAGEVFEAAAGSLPEGQPWSLHIIPCYGPRELHRIGARAWHSAVRAHKAPGPANPPSALAAEAGQHRCRLVREALVEILRRKRRHLLRSLRQEPAPFTESDSLIQLLLTAPDKGFLSVAQAPLPFELRHLLSPFPLGAVPVASDRNAPSRAFAKLVEAELRLGRQIGAGETCVDLGAAPGSWTYVAAGRGARVTAVDRSPLREDLMSHPGVRFQEGDAFRFQPEAPVDWLLCDVIADAAATADLLLRWLQRKWCRHFVVTLKLRDAAGIGPLEQLKRGLPPLTQELFLTRLCSNKKELCAFGSARLL